MKRNISIPCLIIIALLFLSCVNQGQQVQANHILPPFNDIEPFIDGSNQEWAIEKLMTLDNSEEKIRYYNFLLHAYTFLMRYDEQDYMGEYYVIREAWLGFLEEIPSDEVEQMLEDEAWTIDIFYPIERPFALPHDESVDVFFIFRDANPQFQSHPMFAEKIIPVTYTCDIGITPGIVVKAYWAFAERRQEAYQHFVDTFEPIPWQPGTHFEMWHEEPSIIDVVPYQEEIDESVVIEVWDNNGPHWYDESNQGEEASRGNLILFTLFVLGAVVLLVVSISVVRHRKTGEEPEIKAESPEHKEQEKETNIESMITVNCDFCGARFNIVKGKTEKCPYCDCIIRD